MSHLKKFAVAGMTLTMVVGMLPVTAMAAHYNEWVKKSDGYWYYYNDSGHKVKNETRYCSEDSCYYLLNSKGQRVTKKGLITTTKVYTVYGDKISFKRSYYAKEGGALLTYTWKKISGKYYYFDSDGQMVKAHSAYKKYDEKTGKDIYYMLGNDGKKVTKKGWYKAKYTYVDNYDGDKTTYEDYYYVQSDGSVLRNCVKKIGGKYYAFDYDGRMIRNSTYTSNSGKTYLYGDNGARIKKAGIATVTSKYSYTSAGYSSKYAYKYWYYVNKDASVLINSWKKIKGKWYYFGYSGTMYRSTTSSCGESGKTYIFNKKGVCINHG